MGVMDVPPGLLERALEREPTAVRQLVAALTPVVHVRVARAVMRNASVRAQKRNPAEEVRDLAQEVFAFLFANDAKVLRGWQPARGLSLLNFVGLIAEQLVARIFRSGKRRPWPETVMDELELDAIEEAEPGPERALASREYYAMLLDRVRGALSPLGFQLFVMIFIEEQSVASVCATSGLTTDAVYAWRSRLPKLVRKLAVELEAEQPRSEGPASEKASAGVDA
jgi:DNA-directed RNA polymerase specialized sigma24 family protein